MLGMAPVMATGFGTAMGAGPGSFLVRARAMAGVEVGKCIGEAGMDSGLAADTSGTGAGLGLMVVTGAIVRAGSGGQCVHVLVATYLSLLSMASSLRKWKMLLRTW